MFFPRCCIVLYFINYFSLSPQLLLPHSRLLASYESELPNLLVVALVWTERINYYLITCDDIDEMKKKGKKCDDGTNKKYQINNDRNGHKQSHTHSNTHIYELILLYCCWFDYIGLVVASSAVSFYLIFFVYFSFIFVGEMNDLGRRQPKEESTNYIPHSRHWQAAGHKYWTFFLCFSSCNDCFCWLVRSMFYLDLSLKSLEYYMMISLQMNLMRYFFR